MISFSNAYIHGKNDFFWFFFWKDLWKNFQKKLHHLWRFWDRFWTALAMGFLVAWSKKIIGDRNIFARTDFWSTLFLKMFPTSKWAKLNGFEQLTSRAFRIRSQILVAMRSFNFYSIFPEAPKLSPLKG